jgi:DNA-binding transcriptional LysR family regulator
MLNLTPQIKIRHLEVFRAVALSSSIRAAALQLHVSAPAVSASLKQLETLIGFELFARTPNGLQPTAEGSAFYKRIALLYENLDEISVFAMQLRNGAETSLRIASSPNLALRLVPKILKALTEEFPRSTFSIEVLPTKELLNAVASYRADVGVGINLPNGALGTPEHVGLCNVVAAIPRAWSEVQCSEISPSLCLDKPWIRFHPETTQGAATAAWFKDCPTLPPVIASARVARVACSLVEEGLGFALVDEYTAAHTDQTKVRCLPIVPALTYSVDFVQSVEPSSVRLAAAFKRQLLYFA